MIIIIQYKIQLSQMREHSVSITCSATFFDTSVVLIIESRHKARIIMRTNFTGPLFWRLFAYYCCRSTHSISIFLSLFNDITYKSYVLATPSIHHLPVLSSFSGSPLLKSFMEKHVALFQVYTLYSLCIYWLLTSYDLVWN